MLARARGTVVAETLRRHRSEAHFSQKQGKEVTEALLEEMLKPNDKSHDMLLERLEKLDHIFHDTARSKLFGLQNRMSEDELQARQVQGMIHKVEERMERMSSYGKLGGMCLFFLLFLLFLFMIRDVQTSHAIQASVLNSVKSKLPSAGSGGYFNSGQAATGVLSSEDDFYSFVSDTLLSLAFTDPVCGDGICEEPTEYAGFGRFGCVADCGSFKDTSTITISLATYAQTSPDGWDISTLDRDPDPGFKYNIYSETMGDFLFAADSSLTSQNVEVPDGKLRLHLYQTNKTSTKIDDTTLQSQFTVNPGSSPERTATNDFAYGDKREYLSTSIGLLKDVQLYCQSIGLLLGDTNCESFNSMDFGIKALSSYGFSGSIIGQDGDGGSTTLATVPYCGVTVFPNGSDGISNTQNRDILNSAKPTTCDSKRRRRIQYRRDEDTEELLRSGETHKKNNLAQIPAAPGIRRRSSIHKRITPDHAPLRKGRGLLQTAPPGSNNMQNQVDFQSLLRNSEFSPVQFIHYTTSTEELGHEAFGYRDWNDFWIYFRVSRPKNLDFEIRYQFLGNFVDLVTCDPAAAQQTVDYQVYEGGLLGVFPDYNIANVVEDTDWALYAVVCNGTQQIGEPYYEEYDPLSIGPSLSGIVTYPAEAYNSSTDFTDTDQKRLKQALFDTLGLNSSFSELVEITGTSDTRRRLLGGIAVTFTVRTLSNAYAGKFMNILQDNSVFQAALVALGGSSEAEVGSMSITVTGDLSKEGGVCESHWDCPSELFCNSMQACDVCSNCLRDALDAVDGICPVDKCPFSGGYPHCLDGVLLSDGFSCKDTYTFEVWAYNSAGSTVAVKPASQVSPKTITPYNRIVGGIVITQERSSLVECITENRNAEVANYTGTGGVKCPSGELDTTPYGFDPSFMATSTLYNGKLNSDQFYNQSEKTNSSIPLGFFPHSYDANTGTDKSSLQLEESEKDKFKLFFDQRLTSTQANKMLTYAKDGKFIDEKTDFIQVQMVTYNAEHNMFALFTFTFDWQTSGNIKWDYSMYSVDLDVMRTLGGLKIAIFAILWLMLATNCGMEIWDILHSIRAFTLKDYIADPFNWLDWTHFVVLFSSLASCLTYILEIQDFKMQASYPIIHDTVALARPFKTVGEDEKAFLDFVSNMETVSSHMDTFFSLAGIAVVLFIFRLLKSLDFQPRMGLVTRTIYAALEDLLHFFFLFGMVFMGYACVGTLLFGHMYEGMSTLSQSCVTLVLLLLSFDTTQFYADMQHASPGMAFHLFLWSYIIVAFFILLNIFLAILVDAYAHIKQESKDKNDRGLLEEVVEVLSDGVKGLLPASMYLSDSKLLHGLKSLKKAQTAKTGIREQVAKAMAHRKVVLLPGGVEVGDYEMAHFAKVAMHEMHHHGSTKEASQAKAKVAPEDSMRDEHLSLEVLRELMDRYAEDINAREEQRNKDILELVHVENMKQQLAVFKAQAHMMSTQEKLSNVLELVARDVAPEALMKSQQEEPAMPALKAAEEADGWVHVNVIEAIGLPRMDLLRGSDPFCIVFLDRGGQGELFQTEVQRKTRAPVWNESFDLSVTKASGRVTLTVMDKDNITKDDIVGIVNVPLRSLPLDCTVDTWYKIENSDLERQLTKAMLHVAITRTSVPYAEADVKVASSDALRQEAALDSGAVNGIVHQDDVIDLVPQALDNIPEENEDVSWRSNHPPASGTSGKVSGLSVDDVLKEFDLDDSTA